MSNERNYPLTDGSFIQSDLVSTWDDEKWLSEFSILKEAKMHYIIIGTSITEGENTKAIYPTKISHGSMEYLGVDIVDSCLRNAEKCGVKVFLGINFHKDWWRKGAGDPKWLYKQMERGNLIADELYTLYKRKYPKAFYGWYWVYEVDNLNFMTKNQFKVLAKALDINLKHLREKNERLPVMLSPYMNSKYTTAEVYAKNWAYLFTNTELGKGDIFCPQDCVGGGGLDISEVDHWFKELKKAVDCKKGLEFWANNETFDHINWCSAPLNRFVEQMKLVQPYVKNFINFAYCHYYSPNNINKGFHKAYLKYTETGQVDTKPPKISDYIRIEKGGRSKLIISWAPSSEDENINGYELYRNGKLIFTCQRQRIFGGRGSDIVTRYIDTIPAVGSTTTYTYNVAAFDFNGNMSNLSKPAIYELS